MSLIPTDIAHSYDISLYASVQVAVTCAALYDHTVSLGREVELIWMKPLSLITALYVIERYLGDAVLISGVCLCFSEFKSNEVYVNSFDTMAADLHDILSRLGIRLFEFRAWGALAYSWATQATMQLRIYAMYRRSRRTLFLLVLSFMCEIAAIAFIIWRSIGPNSPLQALTAASSGLHFCAFTGVKTEFVYLFIPFLCFECLIFLLAARAFVANMKNNRKSRGASFFFGVNSFMCILARDSLWYFFVNLIACSIVMGLWQGVTELYANICVPLVMFLEVFVGTSLILDFRERYARPSDDPVVSGKSGCSSVYFRSDDGQRDSTYISVRCDVETIVVTDAGV